MVNEFEEMLAIEKERAEERKREATGHREKFHEGESGRAKEKAAEKFNADVSPSGGWFSPSDPWG